jgi:amino acid transporter
VVGGLKVTGGQWLNILVSADATLVLCGSVLTSYVGIIGLVRRMTLDRCLPQFLLYKNPLTGTEPIIIIGADPLWPVIFLKYFFLYIVPLAPNSVSIRRFLLHHLLAVHHRRRCR